MRAGKLRHQITIQQSAESRSGTDIVSAWSTYSTVWASVEPMTVREYHAAQQRQSVGTHTIKLRYLAGITTKMRVSWGSRLFDIKSVLNSDESGKETVLVCEERGV